SGQSACAPTKGTDTGLGFHARSWERPGFRVNHPDVTISMSRLDSFIRRITAQRATLDHICSLIGHFDGPVLELGLGNGRTYDHLRERLPGRRIIAFDRALVAHRGS